MVRQWIVDIQLIADWLDQQDDQTIRLIRAALEVLSQRGPALKRPLVGTISGSRFPNMKELRPPSPAHGEIRILFAFDPHRHAIMLLAGDKANAGSNGRDPTWNDWYKAAIPQADELFARHLRHIDTSSERTRR